MLGKAQWFVELWVAFHWDCPALGVSISHCFLESCHFAKLPLGKEFVPPMVPQLHIHRPRRMVCCRLVIERWSDRPIKLQIVCRSKILCQSGQFHIELVEAVTVGIRANDSSIYYGIECEIRWVWAWVADPVKIRCAHHPPKNTRDIRDSTIPTLEISKSKH